jgi:hypothetical protein
MLKISYNKMTPGQKAAYTKKVRLIPYEEMTPGQKAAYKRKRKQINEKVQRTARNAKTFTKYAWVRPDGGYCRSIPQRGSSLRASLTWSP